MFIPRAVKRPGSTATQTGHQTKKVRNQNHESQAMDTKVTESKIEEEKVGECRIEDVMEEEKVKECSIQQRAPVKGEPICVVCGRYGEYICDETDHDVCSLECKRIDIEQKRWSSSNTIVGLPNQLSLLPPSSVNATIVTTIQSTSDLLHAKLTGYIPHAEINSLTDSQLHSILSTNYIIAKGKNIPRPILNFSHCRLPGKVYENFRNIGYSAPTPIQMQAIPAGLAGRDVLASAGTGTGKTVSFLIPTIMHALSLSQFHEGGKGGPYVLIMAPTRELCAQIEQQTKLLITGLPNMKTALIVGGLPMPNQVHRLSQGIQIAIATPGRFLDILKQQKSLIMNNIYMLVLDEVDMMLKMGFENQVMEILELLPLPVATPRRQVLLFSATIPRNIQSLARKLLRNPINILISNGNDNSNNTTVPAAASKTSLNDILLLKTTPNITVKQTILWVENKSKKKQLFSLLNDPKYYKPPIVVFVESKVGADLLAQAVEKKCAGCRVVSIHGDKAQEERTSILNAFLMGEYDVIVATGVLSRGLDLVNVKMVVLFDMTASVDEYVHQVGRAANWGNQGWAVTFINEDHKSLFREFVKMLKNQPHGRVTPMPSKLLSHGYTLYGKGEK